MSGSSEFSAATLIRNVRVFDGLSDRLSAPSDVLVRAGVIDSISTGPLRFADGEHGCEIDGGGRVVMPGLIDAHWHAAFAALPLAAMLSADVGYVHVAAGREAERTVMRGFTTVRDAGGPTFGLKRAIDEGMVVGPRIFPAGAMISQTSGHGDFRAVHEIPRGVCGHLAHTERIGGTVIADGVDEVLRGVREQLMLGASHIKMMAGGGVASAYDPIDVTQYTEAELRAGVEAAENWGTYVMVHAYTPRAVQQALRAGVKCVDHGHLLDDETVAMIAEAGAWWSLQPFLDDEDSIPVPAANRDKQAMVVDGTDRAYVLAKKHGVKLAWGTDTLFDARLASRQGAQLAKMVRWFTPAEVLRMATHDNAQLCAMAGPRNPYPGRLGEVTKGALADLIIVDGNPLDDLGLIAEPDTGLAVIIKGGRIYKNLLHSPTGQADR
jgi:imidazolonepropionase-like amidohydrolase